MATIACQPPAFFGSSSAAAHTASSWSRASAGSIARIGRWVRSSRKSSPERGGGPAEGWWRGRGAGGDPSTTSLRAAVPLPVPGRIGNFATRSASSITLSGNSCGMPSLWIAIRLKLRGANGSPRMVSTRAASRGGRPTFSARTRSPGCASPRSAIGSSRRSFFSTGRSQKLCPSWWTTPSTNSLPLSSFFIGWASQPLLPSSVRARMRSPTPSAAPLPLRSITRSLGGSPSASHRSGTA